jgi:hypothetical protein
MEDQVKCPRCQSTQLSANKQGFSGTKAVTGAILTGGIGLMAGTIGSNKIKITCLKCGHVFNPGDRPIPVREPGKYDNIAWAVVVICVIATFVILVFYL